MRGFSERVAAALALVVALGVAGVTIRGNSFIPWGTDSGAYLTAARGWATGELMAPTTLTFRFPWAADQFLEAPFGHRPGPTKGSYTSFYPLGYPLLLASALRVGGELAPHAVAPLAAALLAWCGFLLGRRLSSAWAGLMCAILIAASPVTLAHVLIPMSDVPAAAFWALAWVMALRPGRGAAAAAGAAVALTVMIRPNLAPLGLPIAVSVAMASGEGKRETVARLGVFAALAALGPLTLLWSQAALYGAALNSGYPATLDFFFQAGRIRYNASFYPGTFARLHTWLPLAGIVLPLLLMIRARDRQPAQARLIAWTAVAIIAINVALYLAYLTFDEWRAERFMLPAMLALFLLFAALLDAPRVWLAGRRRWIAVLAPLALLPVLLASRALIRQEFVEAGQHRRLLLMGRYLRETLPPRAVILTWAHGGALALATGRSVVRLDRIEPGALDQVVDDLLRSAYEPVFVLDMAVEHAMLVERFKSSRYMAMNWPPRAEFATALIVAFSPARDRDRRLSGDRWPTDVLLHEAPLPHPAWWPVLRDRREAVVLAPGAEADAFRTALEAAYVSVLRREARPTAVDARRAGEGLRRYLRFRLHGCGHAEAVERVARQLQGDGPQPLCAAPAGIDFPPRDETVAFRRWLDAWYAGRGAAPAVSAVDVEGDAVWMQEYLRLRAGGCAHDASVAAVVAQVAGDPARGCAGGGGRAGIGPTSRGHATPGRSE